MQPTSPESSDDNSDEKKIKPASWREFWMFYKHPAIWGSHLFGALIALLAPDDILTQIPALKSFTTFMDGLFPVVGNYAAKSQFPQISELYFATMIALGPLWFWRSWVTPEATLGMSDAPMRKASINWWWFYAACVFWIVATFFPIYFALFLNPGYQFSLLAINESRAILAISGTLFISLFFIMFGGAIHIVRSLNKAFKLLTSRRYF